MIQRGVLMLSIQRHNGVVRKVARELRANENTVRQRIDADPEIRALWARVRRCPRCGGKCDRVPPARLCTVCASGNADLELRTLREMLAEAQAERDAAATRRDELRADLDEARRHIRHLEVELAKTERSRDANRDRRVAAEREINRVRTQLALARARAAGVAATPMGAM